MLGAVMAKADALDQLGENGQAFELVNRHLCHTPS